MDERELRARLRAADPARGADAADSWIDDLAGATMSAETSSETGSETGTRKGAGAGGRSRPRRTWALVAAAAVVAAVGGGAAVALTSGDDDPPRQEQEAKDHDVLELSLPAGDAMGMCIEFSPEALAPMEVAFSGEARDVDGTTVHLAPDHWYRGGDGADEVTLTAGDPAVLLEGGIVFEEGERYLVSANGGEVATCGLSGPYTEEMAAAYDEAFAR